jgi:hypothetical protein
MRTDDAGSLPGPVPEPALSAACWRRGGEGDGRCQTTLRAIAEEKTELLLEPLRVRELEVLLLVARGT